MTAADRASIMSEVLAGLPRLVTMDEAAGLLRVTRRTLQSWIRSGRLPACKSTPTRKGKVLIPRMAIERLLGEMADAALTDYPAPGFGGTTPDS